MSKNVKIFAVSIFLLLFLAGSASAHVRYVLDKSEVQEGLQAAAPFFNAPIAVGFIVFVIALFALDFRFYKKGIKLEFIRNMEQIKDYVPLILRVFIGTGLIVAGLNGWLLSVDTPVEGVGVIQIVLGTLLLLGFLTRIAAAGLVFLWLFSLLSFGMGVTESGAMHHLEVAGVGIFLMLWGSSVYGLDNMIKINIGETLTRFKKYDMLILRATLGITLIWLSIVEKLLYPGLGVAVVEKYALPTFGVDAATFVFIAGLVEFSAGLAILLGLTTRFITLVAAIFVIIGIITFGESVSSHFGFVGVALAIIIRGASGYSVDDFLKNFVKTHE
ncbi:MAG: DoxX family protein [Candidatus Mariimomonas ferrooxydans]